MMIVRRLALVLLLLPVAVFAQSADQEVVSAVDAPDPVAPGATLSYTVTVRNNGPDPATNGGININLPLAVTHLNSVAPAGWTCGFLGNNGTCNTPSFAAGTTEVITINVTVGAHLANFPDQSIMASFFPSGTTPDPNNANNTKNATTQVDAPQIDLSVTASDSPDPVFPDGNVTYTVNVANAGPDAATTVNFNAVPNSSLKFVSSNQPAGWNCTFPAVGAVNATFTCSRPSYASGAADTFTIVYNADDAQFGINDTTFFTNFSVNGVGDDTNDPNNTVTVSTAYTTPDADVTLSVVDSPDPVNPNGNITYTVTVGNTGPDTAPSITLNSFGGNNLRFISATVPAGWNCTLPPSGTQTTSLTCNLPGGMVNGGSSVLTFVMNADAALLGINDGTILFGFSASSTISDPDNSDNSETESTAYVTPDADLTVTASDSPDPVAPDGDITYTVTVGNTGPDTASATLTVPMNGTLKFTSITTPAGFTCTGTPAPGGSTSFSCNNPAFANGATAVFTIVLNADFDAFGNFDQTINQVFSVTGNVVDPDNSDNMVTVSTTYDVANANLGVTATDAPDPVAAGSNLTYTGAVTNAGPDTATNVSLQIPMAASLLFQSIVAPAGFTCTTPAVGGNAMITCTIASLANGANLPFSLVTQVNPTVNNGPDGVIQQGFLIGSSTNDPVGTNNTLQVDTVYTTPDANLVATNSDAPDPATVGGTITYTQTLTNNGPDTAVNATFTQGTPAGTTFQSIAAPAGWTCATPAAGGTGTITCSKATMLSGEVSAFTLVVNVTGTGSIGSTVTGDSDTYDPDPTNNTATTSTNGVTPANADLSVSMTSTTTAAPVGSTFDYTITVTNNGPDGASTVTLTDILPASLLFRQITPPAGFTCTTPDFRTNGTITCTAATLPNGSNAVFTLTVEVAPGATSPIVNGVTVSSTTTDPNGGNSSTSAPGIVPGPSSAAITIAKTTTSTFATPGGNVTYTITVSNAGPSTATGVVVNDTLPAGLTFVSATPSQGTCNAASPVVCNLGSILAGGNATVTLVANVTATSGTISNTATATSPDATGPATSTTPAIPVSTGEPVAGIPTLSEWMLLVLAGLLGVAALTKMRL